MKINQNKWQWYQVKLLIFTFSLLSVSACAANWSQGNSAGEGTYQKKVCEKYAACGCQDYEKCIEETGNLKYSDRAYECVLKSSCESLCAGKPDGCSGAESIPQGGVPQTPDCSRIRCTSNNDCPGGCYGGCSDGYCLLF
ncbi:MAG: hypothetical protein H0U54_02705 [Acidobacteria bacterium]|nr:hypothetical protein [Acidobacteriota bacterium]